MPTARLLAVASALPAQVVPNAYFSGYLDTTDEWIQSRTGITQRHWATDETTAHLAIAAARKVLVHLNMDAASLDLVLVATITPDAPFPSTASQVQAAIGAHKAAAMDIQAVCAGFVYALATANVKAGVYRRVLVIGAEVFSRLLDKNDRTTAILFGDGAGAAVLEAAEKGGIIATHLASAGQHQAHLYAGGTPPVVHMQGREVFRHAVTEMSSSCLHLLHQQQLDITAIDWLIPHQANQRILEAVGEKLGIATQKVVSTVALHANTSAASIPLALSVALADGRIQPGQRLLLTALGGGFVWGSCLIEF
jgi:3-oxoacyl-[acyl-carrier-protein] synthase III